MPAEVVGKKTKGGILAKIRSVSYTLIPLNELRDLPTRKGLGIIATFYFLLFALFIYLVVNGFYLHKNDKYLSLEEEQYEGFGDCENIPRQLDGRFVVDTNGNWDGNILFKHALGIYDFTFTKFEGNMEHYQLIVQSALDQYDYIGSLFTTRNLGHNMLVWMAFSDTAIYQGGKQIMSLTGDPRTVFNRKRRVVQIGYVNGSCEVTPAVLYDSNNGILTVTYDVERFKASPTCMNSLNIRNETMRFANAWFDDQKDYTLEIDMQSLVTASAINQGILPTYELEMVPYSDYILEIEGDQYNSGMFFYSKFSNMDPLHCVFRANMTTENTGSREELFCAIQISGNYYGLPTFNHVGTSYEVPSSCDCTAEHWACNTFQFLSGFVFYNDADDLASLLLVLYKNLKGEKLNSDAYKATFGTLSNNETMRNASDWRTNAFSFCQLSNGKSCSVMSIYTGDLEGLYSVNGEYVQLPWGSCNNTVSLSNASKTKLLNTPPYPLSEPYFECKKNAMSTLSDEFSAAVGIIIPLRLSMIVFLAFLLFIISKHDEKSYKSHTFKEKQNALDFFANTLLLIRDGKFDKSKKYDMETLIRLQHELKQLGDIPKFYEVEMTSTSGVGSSGDTDANSTVGGRHISVTGVSKTYLDSIENPLRSSEEE